MSSFFPFSSSSTNLSTSVTVPPLLTDDPHLEVTVTPSASAFYAGETFSATISFRNTRVPHDAIHSPPGPSTSNINLGASSLGAPINEENSGLTSRVVSAVRPPPSIEPRGELRRHLPERQGQIGLHIASAAPKENGDEDHVDGNAEAGPSRPAPRGGPGGLYASPSLTSGYGRGLGISDYPYSPGANPSHRAAWPSNDAAPGPTIRSPDQWDLAGRNKRPGHSRRARSLALGKGQLSPQQMVWALGGHPHGPPPLPRRPQGRNHIPSRHPHARQDSIMSLPAPSPVSGNIGLPDMNEGPDVPQTAPFSIMSQLDPGLGHSGATSRVSSARSLTPMEEDDDAAKTNGNGTIVDLTSLDEPPGYGAGLRPAFTPPPPSHPYTRSQQPRLTTVLWAYTRLKATFHPSNTHIPPDPLLPLRSLMLHQPIGSGSLLPNSESSSTGGRAPSRWQMSFGTGTIGNSTQPSLTGSLFGLAKDLMTGGAGGSLEEERKRVWNMKDLPVFETSRSLLGVDLRLKEGEAKEFTYSLKLPNVLPPSYRGKAFRFSYELVVSLNVALPGGGKRQRTAEVLMPIRVWSNVSIADPLQTYDVLRPVIHRKDEGIVRESRPHFSALSSGHAQSMQGDTEISLQSYAHHLLDNIEQAKDDANGSSPRLPPISPTKTKTAPKLKVLSPSSPATALPPRATSTSPAPSGPSRHLIVPGNGNDVDSAVDDKPPAFRHRSSSFVEGDDELVEDAVKEDECREAVEILSRHSPKSTYEIAKDGEPVAALTLTKTVFRLGESIIGVANFNGEATDRRVLSFSAFLESHEIIPERLRPHGDQHAKTSLDRLHAEYRSGYTINTSRLAFALDIPSEATPGFSLSAGKDGLRGGLEWKVRLAMLVSVPRKRRSASLDSTVQSKAGAVEGPARQLVSVGMGRDDHDNKVSIASTSLSPVVTAPLGRRTAHEGEKGIGEDVMDLEVETIECEVPVRILAGNTAFLVRPKVQVI